MSTTHLELLLVDDDPAIQRLLAYWLRQAGYEVRVASNGLEAIEEIESHPPHVLITDWEMPEVSGIELCTWLRQQTLPHYVYTVFLSVRDDSKTLIQGLDAGADDFLKKPIDRGELIDHDILGFEVAMNDALCMRCAHGLADTFENIQKVDQR